MKCKKTFFAVWSKEARVIETESALTNKFTQPHIAYTNTYHGKWRNAPVCTTHAYLGSAFTPHIHLPAVSSDNNKLPSVCSVNMWNNCFWINSFMLHAKTTTKLSQYGHGHGHGNVANVSRLRSHSRALCKTHTSFYYTYYKTTIYVAVLPAKHLLEKFNCVLLRHEARKTGPDIMVSACLVVTTRSRALARSKEEKKNIKEKKPKCMANTLDSYSLALCVPETWDQRPEAVWLCERPFGTSFGGIVDALEESIFNSPFWMVQFGEAQLNCTSRSYLSNTNSFFFFYISV